MKRISNFIIGLSIFSLCSCVSKEKYDEVVSQNEELSRRVESLQIEVRNSQSNFEEIQTKLVNTQNSYYEISESADKAMKMLKAVNDEVSDIDFILFQYIRNSDISNAYTKCKDIESTIADFISPNY